MLTSSVEYSISEISYKSGIESAKMALEKVKALQLLFYIPQSSIVKEKDQRALIVQQELNNPIIGCNSDGIFIVSSRVVNESTVFSGVML